MLMHYGQDLSASSRMRISTPSRWKQGALWRWSMRRPGVATTMSGERRRAASWVFMLRPPDNRDDRVMTGWWQGDTRDDRVTTGWQQGDNRVRTGWGQGWQGDDRVTTGTTGWWQGDNRDGRLTSGTTARHEGRQGDIRNDRVTAV